MAVKAVLFDYGGVLTVSGRRGSISSTVTELFGIDIGWEKLDALHDKLRRGLISTEVFLEELGKLHDTPKRLTVADWHEVSQDVFARSEPVYDLAERLRAHNIQTSILSNVYQMTADMLRQLGNYDGFEPLILSCEVKLAKPDPEIFQLAIDRLSVNPKEIIFVDDQEKNIPVAESFGMHAVLAVTADQIVRDVEQLIEQENDLTL